MESSAIHAPINPDRTRAAEVLPPFVYLISEENPRRGDAPLPGSGKIELESVEIATTPLGPYEKRPVRAKPKEVAPHRSGFQQTFQVENRFDS